MAVSRHQRVAGVDYVVTFPPRAGAPALDAIEAEFISPHPPAGDGIRVDLVAREAPDLSAWTVLASSGPAWSIRGRGAQRCLCLGMPSAARAARVAACWSGDASRAEVYCGPEYYTAGPDGVELRHSASYPVNQMLFIYYLARRQGLLVHAAGLAAGDRGLIFPGVSGAGKSTLARQFLAAGWSSLLSDDRILVRWLDGAWQAFGTPWPGDAGVAVNAGAALAALLFPARGEETRIRELSPQAALDRLLPATSMLWHEPELLTGQLETCERLLRAVPAYELAWSPARGVVGDVRAFVERL